MECSLSGALEPNSRRLRVCLFVLHPNRCFAGAYILIKIHRTQSPLREFKRSRTQIQTLARSSAINLCLAALNFPPGNYTQCVCLPKIPARRRDSGGKKPYFCSWSFCIFLVCGEEKFRFSLGAIGKIPLAQIPSEQFEFLFSNLFLCRRDV